MTMIDRLSPLDRALLEDFQRDLPLVAAPFAAMAGRLGVDEETVLERLCALKEVGAISRVGATFRPNTAGASTLAALAVPATRIEEVAGIVSAEAGVNHSYLREHDWNLWFVATARDAYDLAASLTRIEARTGLPLLDLRLVRAFNVDLGFSMRGPRKPLSTCGAADVTVLCEDDRPILSALADGLNLVPRPFAALGKALGRTEAAILERIAILARARILTRIGVIVRHRTLGWRANAMVVWDVPEERIEAAGRALCSLAGVTLCYQRRTVPGVWPYALFSMIHGRSRDETLGVLATAEDLPELTGIRRQVLFSTRCYKQTAALLQGEAAA
ncbi:DNA-binding Lrp family transcriptional regulator [Rhodobium orientis]|nr:DNA-binding Lrp family transcriptional regulator [Rhodobium orientis]